MFHNSFFFSLSVSEFIVKVLITKAPSRSRVPLVDSEQGSFICILLRCYYSVMFCWERDATKKVNVFYFRN